MRIFNFIFLLFLLAAYPVCSQVRMFPTPAKYSIGKGVFHVNGKTVAEGAGEYAVKLASGLRDSMKMLRLPDGDAGSNRILFNLKDCPEIKKEGYRLTVSPEEILLEASTESGLFYARETVLQLIRFYENEIPLLRIEDYPRYEWRGFMLDESRHFFGKEKVKQYLDVMASLKMNVFHWHLTDEPAWRMEIKRYPKLTAVGATGNYHDSAAAPAFYTQDDIREIVACAAERHIMIIPEFDMPGHATSACRAYPEVSGGGEGRWKDFTFHPCREQTYEFINNVIDEIVALFPSPYVHIGGDEVHYGNQSWFADPEIQRFIKDKGLKNEVGLEHYFIRRVVDMLASKGKTVIGWDEIVDAGVSPSKVAVMWWRHDRKYQFLKALEQGFKVVMTPRRPLYGDFVQHGSHKIGRFWNGYNTIEDICRFPESIVNLMQGYEEQVAGLQMSMWTERIGDGNRLDYMVFPRLAAVAESGWTPAKSKECSLFMQKLPLLLKYLDWKNIYYFNPLNPLARPEPPEPKRRDDVLQNG